MLANSVLNVLSSDLKSCMLTEEGVEVAGIIAGYICKEIFDKRKCDVCEILFPAVKSDSTKLTTSRNFIDWDLWFYP